MDADTTALPDDWVRPLGWTGLAVSAVCAGGAPLGSMPQNFGYAVPEERGLAVVRAVLDSPIRFLDTANGYSAGESERRIGAAVAAAGGVPADFLVATKVDARDGDYSGARVRESVRESEQRLGLGTLPLVYLHDPEFHDFAAMTAPGGAVETLMRLRDEGRIGHVGLAGGDVHAMRRYLDLGGFEALLVHNRWTLVDHSAGELIAEARERGVAVVNAAVYGGGIIAGGDSRDYGYRPARPATIAAIASMRRVCEAHGTTLATAALQASVADERITSTVIGFSRPERVRGIVEAASTPPPPGLLDELASLLPGPDNWLDFDH